MIEIVSATRHSEEEFRALSPLGLTISRLFRKDSPFTPKIEYDNNNKNNKTPKGLPEIYNARIDAPDNAEYLIFVHDDVWIEDFFLSERILEGLAEFDVIGLAGSKHRHPGQFGWAHYFLDGKVVRDDQNSSGTVAHGPCPFGTLTRFGKVPEQCELLDGLFLAAKKETLVKNTVRFDPRFRFQFYDLDLCRRATKGGLRLGTWSISVTHTSGGAYCSPEWEEARKLYFQEWKD